MKISIPITVDIELSLPSVVESPHSNVLFEDKLHEHLLELIDDLGLPLIPQVNLSQKASYETNSRDYPTVTIEGRHCRQKVNLHFDSENSYPEQFLRFFSSVLYSNRLRLLTNRMMHKLSESQPVQLVALLPEILQYGCSLKIAEDIAREINPKLSVESQRYQVELGIANRFPKSVGLEVNSRLHELIIPVTKTFRKMLGMMRDGLFYELGVKFPPVQLVCCENLADFEFRPRIGQVLGPIQKTLNLNEFLINDTPERLEKLLKIYGQPSRNPLNGMLCTIVKGADTADLCERAGFTTWDWGGYIVLSLAQVLRENAEVVLTVTEVQRTLSELSEAFPLPIVNLLKRFSPIYIVGVLRALVKEGFSIRDLRSVIEAMLEINGQLVGIPVGSIVVAPPATILYRSSKQRSGELSPEDCAEYVRMAMKGYLTNKYARQGELNVIETTAGTEARLRTMSEISAQPEHAGLISKVEKIAQQAEEWLPKVILTSFDVRRKLREAIAIEFPDLPVLSREEIDKSVASLRNCGTIIWE